MSFCLLRRYRLCSSLAAPCLLFALLGGCTKQNSPPVSEGPRIMEMTDNLEQASLSGKSLMEAPIPPSIPSEQAWGRSVDRRVRELGDYRAFHLLFLLKGHAPDEFKALPASVKASVLVSNLENVQYLNDWGYLDPKESYDGRAAQALIDVGKPALPMLRKLLADKREAPLFGTEEATMSHRFGYRRADYAYRYVMLILGREPAFSVELRERDRLISTLQNELSAASSRP